MRIFTPQQVRFLECIGDETLLVVAGEVRYSYRYRVGDKEIHGRNLTQTFDGLMHRGGVLQMVADRRPVFVVTDEAKKQLAEQLAGRNAETDELTPRQALLRRVGRV